MSADYSVTSIVAYRVAHRFVGLRQQLAEDRLGLVALRLKRAIARARARPDVPALELVGELRKILELIEDEGLVE